MSKRPKKHKPTVFKFNVIQNGECVASGEGSVRSITFKEALHYAMMYGQDGPVTIKWKKL